MAVLCIQQSNHLDLHFLTFTFLKTEWEQRGFVLEIGFIRWGTANLSSIIDVSTNNTVGKQCFWKAQTESTLHQPCMLKWKYLPQRLKCINCQLYTEQKTNIGACLSLHIYLYAYLSHFFLWSWWSIYISNLISTDPLKHYWERDDYLSILYLLFDFCD